MRPPAPPSSAPPARGTRLPIAPEGWPIIGAIAAIAAAAGALALWVFGPVGAPFLIAGLVVTLWAVWFFRDFDVPVPTGETDVVSPADGVVVSIGPCPPPADLGLAPARAEGMTRISVFMNVFNVHVNRAPAPGRVTKIAYRPGRFFNASLDKASEHNERNALALELDDGRTLAVVQIAGLIARRIVCRVREGQRLARGERFGLIRFGSRVDLYLPPGAEIRARLRQKVTAGSTILATLPPLTSPAPAARAAGVQEVR